MACTGVQTGTSDYDLREAPMNLKCPTAHPVSSSLATVPLIGTTTALLLSLLAALLAFACGGDSAGDAAALQAREWRAVEITGLASVLPYSKGAATATFKDGKVTGSGTVNRYFGSYELGSDNAIRISDIGATEMAGPPEAMAQESAYFEALQRSATYQVTETSLIMVAKDGSVLIEFEVIPPPPLTGTVWRATTLGAEEETDPDTPVTDLKVTALFGADGTLTGNASVNQYSTTYTVSDSGRMTIDPNIATTKMAGPPELMAIEKAYLAALAQVTNYEIKGSVLWLRDAAGADLMRFTAGI